MKKKILFLLLCVVLMMGCVTTPDRVDQQRQYFEIQRQYDESINKQINLFIEETTLYDELRNKLDHKEKRFYRTLTNKQQEKYDIYQEEKSPNAKSDVTALLTQEQKRDFDNLIKDNDSLQELTQMLNRCKKAIIETKQESERFEKQWNIINRQMNHQEQRYDAAWGRFQDSLQKLGDDMQRRSRYPNR
jgi:hypothetical protein